MNVDTTLLNYFLNAGIVVKLVMLLLITASVFSWTYILQRFFYLKDIREAASNLKITSGRAASLPNCMRIRWIKKMVCKALKRFFMPVSKNLCAYKIKLA